MQRSKLISLWPIPPFGFDGDDDDDGGDTGDGAGATGAAGAGQGGQGGSQGNSGKGGTGKGGSATSDDDDDDDDPYAGLTEAELKKRLASSETNRKTAEKDKKALEDQADKDARSKRTKEDNLTRDLSNVTAERDALLETNTRLLLINGILNSTDYKWHNAEIVAQQLNPKNVTVDPKTGTVEGLKKELKRVATDHAYLLVSQQNSGGNNGNNQQQRQNGVPTGVQPGQGGSTNGGLQDRTQQELANDYPALIGRV